MTPDGRSVGEGFITEPVILGGGLTTRSRVRRPHALGAPEERFSRFIHERVRDVRNYPHLNNPTLAQDRIGEPLGGVAGRIRVLCANA